LNTSSFPCGSRKKVLHFGSACRSADLDEAIEIASKHPMAKYGLVEIRPFWPFE
jgi:hypothetical protein